MNNTIDYQKYSETNFVENEDMVEIGDNIQCNLSQGSMLNSNIIKSEKLNKPYKSTTNAKFLVHIANKK